MQIDFANSPFTGTSPQLLLCAAFDATELNRIMNELPVVSGGQIMDIGGCDGYYTCDRSIATTKGWTIRGWAIFNTVAISNINRTTATSGGNIEYNGGYTPTAKGVCWALSPAVPTISNAKTSDGATDGSFVSNMTALTPAKTYNVRAYVTTAYGATVYGEMLSFTTLP
jgi:hypothetical protein